MANPNTFPEQEAEVMETMNQAEQMGAAPDHAPPLPDSIAIEVNEVEQGAEAISVRRGRLQELGKKALDFISSPDPGDEPKVIRKRDKHQIQSIVAGSEEKPDNPGIRMVAHQRKMNRQRDHDIAAGPDFSGQRSRGDH